MKTLKLFSLLILCACSTTIKDFDKYKKAPLLQTEFMPNPESISSKTPSVVIFEFKTTNKNAETIGATSIVEGEIANILLGSKLATVQNRQNLKKLENEIKLAELQTGVNTSLNSVNYAIDGEVSSITFSSRYVGPVYNEDKSLKRKAMFEYTASAQGFIRIIEVPSLITVENIQFNSTVFSNQETRSENNLSIGKFNLKTQEKPKEFDENLARLAIQRAISSNADKIKSIFAKTGYVIEKRVLNDKSIFLVTLGARDGIRQEDKVEFLQKYEDLNVLTGKRETLQRTVAFGVVADKTEETKTWIVVPKEQANLIKLGDPVKVRYIE
jgi:hypothetical protein